jgi:hypothetical protein
LYGQIGWLLPFENTIHISGCESILVDRVNSVRKETAIIDEEALEVHGGHFVPSRQGDDQSAMNDRRSACRHNQTAIAFAHKRHDAPLDFVSITQANGAQF